MQKELSNGRVMMKMIVLVTPLMGWMLAAILLGILGFLCAIFIPVSAALMIAQGVSKIIFFDNTHILIFMLAIAVLRGILRYGEQACNHYIAFTLLAILRDRVFGVLRKLAPAKLEGQDKGNLISLITSDIELLEVFYAHTISPIVIAIITSLLMLILFLKLHLIFALLALLAYVFVGLIIPLLVSRWGRKEGDIFRKRFANLSSYTLESIRGLGEILQYQYGDKRMQDMKSQSEQLNVSQKFLRKQEGKSSALSGMGVQLFSLLVLFCGLGLYHHGDISFPVLLLSTVLMFSSFGPVIALANVSNNLLQTLASGRRVLSLLDEKAQVEDIEGKDNVAFDELHLDNVTFAYGEEMILQEVSETFEKGKITGIHGKSGSGKSTMLKLMMRFWDVQSGMVSIGNNDIRNINTVDLRTMQSYVTQESILFHDTIENNIKIANLKASPEDVMKACKQASIHEFILSLPKGYDTMVSELGESLSGGERQRIAIARAFLHNSPCVFLDEPTSNLDALNEAVILKSLKQQSGRSIVLVSHRLSTMKICDRVVHMDEGRVS